MILFPIQPKLFIRAAKEGLCVENSLWKTCTRFDPFSYFLLPFEIAMYNPTRPKEKGHRLPPLLNLLVSHFLILIFFIFVVRSRMLEDRFVG
jgi:hypothetical protein